MEQYDSTTVKVLPVLSSGIFWGFIGVLAFSFTVPFTRVAVADAGMPALFVGAGRAAVAGVVAGLVLFKTRQQVPSAGQWLRVCVVAAGVVFGFPFFTSFALGDVPSNHAAVVIGLLPAATAVVAVIRTGEHPSRVFWVWSVLGAVAATCFVVIGTGGIEVPGTSDLFLVAAVVSAAIGYAEGGVLSRELGSWQTVSWALVASLPISIPLAMCSWSTAVVAAPAQGLLAFGYLALVSMYLGFFAWYRGLSIGTMAQVSQIQLTQPVMTILWSTLLLGESVPLRTVIAGAVVIACALLAVRARA